ncbi:MAG: ATP-binding protein [Coriobacteriia bacterium]|nr:ATP-binding protein [Coriobacteriia bacterium]
MEMQITKGKIERAQKVLIYGVEGVGKSTLASQFPSPLFIDTEDGTTHLDVARLPRPASWEMLLEEVKWVRDSLPRDVATLVIDTADWAEELCREAVLASHLLKGKPASGIEDYGYGHGFTYLAEDFGRLINLLSDVCEKGLHTVVVAHAQISRFEEPDQSGSYDRYELKLYKKVSAMLREWADMVLFIGYKTQVVKDADGKARAYGGTDRVIHTGHTSAYDAKNRHGLPSELELGFGSIADAVRGGQAAYTAPVMPAPALEAEGDGGPEEPLPFGPAPYEAGQGPLPANVWLEFDEPDVPEHLRPLYQLFEASGVTEEEFCMACELKGYAAKGMRLADYDPDFISGRAVPLWDQVLKVIEEDVRPDVSPRLSVYDDAGI